jgi:hypothetical protein
MKRLFLALPLIAICGAAGWYGYGAYLASIQPKVEIRALSSLPISRERTLPFYELMSPLPSLSANQLIPRLEYKKGPPKRYIERISLLVQPANGKSSRERIVYHGRRTRTDFPGIGLLPAGATEAQYLETALRLSQGQDTKLGAWRTFLLKPFLLRESLRWLQSVESVAVMDQAGSPAFFFAGAPTSQGRVRSTALFIRRNSFYRVDYTASQGFQALAPEKLFRKSFLTERRADALEYLAKNLSEVNLGQRGLTEFRSIAWPILLLAANVSVDPSSIQAYFHFAGISALLYRSVAMDHSDSETLDILRNNVLASEFYARDVNPASRQTAEIGRLARLLTRNFE